MSPTTSVSIRRGSRERRIVIGLLVLALLGLAFSPGTEGAIQRALGRSVGLPSGDPTEGTRQLAEPGDVDTDIPVALAATAQAAPSTSAAPLPRADRTEAVANAVTSVTADQSAAAAPATTTTEAPQVAAASAAPQSNPAPSPERSTPAPSPAPTPSTAPPTTTAPSTAPTTTTTVAPSTTTAAPTTTTTAAPAATPAGGWVTPAQTGHRTSNLHQFAAANDGPAGVTIDQAFLDANSGAPWLSYEGNRPVISRMDASGRCLNILVTLTLRDSLINCPTRVQNDSWGYAGQVDDAPAVNVLAQNVIVEHNTITCSGHDGNICSRSVRAGSGNTTIQYNDLSFARGAVATYHGTVFRYNYVHDLSFGFDPTRAGSADNVTHNNAVNNLGYTNVLIEGNYIIARYGRVSAQPGTYRAPSFHGVYAGGVVEVGDPINGFVFANYLVNGNGANFRVLDNYVVGAGRPFQCNGSSRHSGASCGANVSGNAFASDRFADFTPAALFYDSEGAGSIAGSCNVRSVSGGFQVLPADAFGSAGTHGTSGC